MLIPSSNHKANVEHQFLLNEISYLRERIGLMPTRNELDQLLSEHSGRVTQAVRISRKEHIVPRTLKTVQFLERDLKKYLHDNSRSYHILSLSEADKCAIAAYYANNIFNRKTVPLSHIPGSFGFFRHKRSLAAFLGQYGVWFEKQNGVHPRSFILK